jgi:methionyl aminopeptidase
MNQETKLRTASNTPPSNSGGATIKSPREMEAVRRAGAVVAATIAALKSAVRPGITTAELDRIAYREIARHGAKPTFKGYYGFPACICTSLNHEIVHGIPSDKVVIKEGDILKLDVGATLDGFIGDAAVSVPVGKVSKEAMDLMEATEQALEEGIKASVVGARTGDIGQAVESYAASRGYQVVRQYVGHGVGRNLHEEPQIPNYGPAGRGALLKAGMALAIEPMLNVGDWRAKVLEDQWTVVTADGSLSSHFEHTLLVTEQGPEVVTRIRK